MKKILKDFKVYFCWFMDHYDYRIRFEVNSKGYDEVYFMDIKKEDFDRLSSMLDPNLTSDSLEVKNND